MFRTIFYDCVPGPALLLGSILDEDDMDDEGPDEGSLGKIFLKL